MTYYQGSNAVLTAQFLSGGAATDVSSLTITVTPVAGGAAVVGPTAAGIVRISAGTYTYTWAVPAGQAIGDYLVLWDATETDATEIITVLATRTDTWATVPEVLALVGATVTGADLAIAQTMVEIPLRRVWRASDAGTSDEYWLKRVTAWQARHVHDHPELLQVMDGISSTGQDGWNVSFQDGSIMRRLYHPMAFAAANNLRGAMNTSLRMNSAFQKGGTSRRWRRL